MLQSCRHLFVALCLLAAAPLAASQEPTPLSSAELEARIQLLESSDAQDKAAQIEALQQALAEVKRAAELRLRTAEFRRQAEEAPPLLSSLRQELSTPADRSEPALDPNASLRDLELLQQQAESTRAAAQKLVEELASEAEFRNGRLAVIADEIARVRALRLEREEALRTTVGTDAVSAAKREALSATLDALQAEEEMLSAERATYESRRELLPLRRDRAQRQLTRAEQLARLWMQRVNAKRQAEANSAALDAAAQRREAAEQSPVLRDLADANAELAALRAGGDGVPARITAASNKLARAQQRYEESLRRFAATQRKVAVGGLSKGMGILLRSEREWLESGRESRAERQRRNHELSEAQLLQISLQEERAAIGDLATHANQLLLGVADSIENRAELESLALELLRNQRSLHDNLIEELSTLITTLLEQESLSKLQQATGEAYRDYIEERILWIPSVSGGFLPSLTAAGGATAWLLHPQAWLDGLTASLEALPAHGALALALLLLVLVPIGMRRRLREGVAETTEAARSYRTDRFRSTLRALLGSILLALPIPAALWAAGWLLLLPSEPVQVVARVGAAAQQVAYTYLALEVLRQLCAGKGLGIGHFRWHAGAAARVRRLLHWFAPLSMAALGLIICLDRQLNAAWNDSLGRLTFMALMGMLAWAMHRLFHKGRSILEEHYRKSNSMLERTHHLWAGLLTAIPVALLLLALSGYYYTALELFFRVHATFGLLLLLVLVNSLLLRGLFIARRRLAVDQAKQRALTRMRAAEDESMTREPAAIAIDEEEVDIPAVDAQTRQLIRSGVFVSALLGLFLIWASAFPALRTLDRVQIWPDLRVISVESTTTTAMPGRELDANSNGEASVGIPIPGSQELLVPQSVDLKESVVTLADLLLAIVLLAATVMLAKNAPGVLEIAVLQRLPLDSGSRHALTTLFRYLVFLVGISVSFGAIGISWDTIQWLAAALTFGLAFGLQEIFANFVSGLIILIERPIRVGDLVTVGNIDGRVTKLRMRATTILDWDRREMLVPNKEFITNSVVNWTLSDPVTRVIVPVGVAYGSDTQKARDTLMNVARQNPLVLADPAPSAIFRRFGDSTLDFELRVFMANRDLWPEIIHKLHMQIDAAFRAEGIEIAFPQRDLHIRSAEGLTNLGGKPEESS